MARRKGTGPTAERFIDETLALIEERGGSQGVNLRAISRRVGCAHTNAYNYFESLEDLLWAAFRRGLRDYGESLAHGLDGGLPRTEYLRRLIANLAAYPEERPGRYRFIASDPIDLERIPADVLETVTRMKQWLADVLSVCAPTTADTDSVADTCDIVLAYIDGETLNLINGRVVPGEDVRGRVVDNAMRLLYLLSGDDASGPLASTPAPGYPTLHLEADPKEGRQMDLVWGLVLVALGLFAWLGQTIALVSPDIGVRLQLMEAEDAVEPVYWADIRGEALWDALSLWTLPLAGLLLVLGQPAWAALGLVGGGVYAYFAGRGIATRLVMLRRGHRIGDPSSVRTAFIALAVWLAAALFTIVAAAMSLEL